jgi:hypothetical protein
MRADQFPNYSSKIDTIIAVPISIHNNRKRSGKRLTQSRKVAKAQRRETQQQPADWLADILVLYPLRLCGLASLRRTLLQLRFASSSRQPRQPCDPTT